MPTGPEISLTPRFHLKQVHYKVGAAITVDTNSVPLDDTAFVTVTIYYRAKPQSSPVVVLGQPKLANGTWAKVKEYLYFTPTLPGLYSIVLTALTFDQATYKAASIATFKIDRLTVVG
jgi:hypothetical protein